MAYVARPVAGLGVTNEACAAAIQREAQRLQDQAPYLEGQRLDEYVAGWKASGKSDAWIAAQVRGYNGRVDSFRREVARWMADKIQRTCNLPDWRNKLERVRDEATKWLDLLQKARRSGEPPPVAPEEGFLTRYKTPLLVGGVGLALVVGLSAVSRR